MVDFGHGSQLWQRKFADYPMNLICVNELTDFSCFRMPLRELFSIMRYRRDKKGLKMLLKKDPEYQEMDEGTAQVIGVLMGVDKFMEKCSKYRKEDKYNMCQALQEMMEDSRQDGREEGREEVIRALVETYQDFGVSKGEAAIRIMEKCSISKSKAEALVVKYWG